jgi:hypothetical protein
MELKPASYPLRIGVTGHRSLSDESAVADAVTRVLEYIEKTLQYVPAQGGMDRHWYSRAIDITALTLVRPLLKPFGLPAQGPRVAAAPQTELDWTVISPLAKGADRIVARAVMTKAGANLHAVTALPLDEYRKDFRESEDRKEFEELLQLDQTPTELHNEQDASEIDWSNELHRSQAYYNVGLYVVGACELLIAIWDGKMAAGFGGTGDVVRYAIKRGKSVIWIDANEPHRPACLLVPDAESKAPFAGAKVASLPSLPKQLSLGCHRLSAYNRDPLISEADLKQATDREIAQLREQASQAGLPRESLKSIEQNLLPLYARADLMAAAYQRLYLFGAKALFRLSAFAVSIAVLQLLFFPLANWLIAFEVLAMLAAVLLLRVSRVEVWHEKWLNDRHLAEWLRTVTFTALLGDHHRGSSTATKFPFYEGPDQWFVDAFQGLVARVKSETPAIEFKALKHHLVEEWIAGQAAWHARNAHRKHKSAHLYHWAGVACFCVTLVMATLHMFGFGHDDHDDHDATIAQHDHEDVDPHADGHEDDSETRADPVTEYNRLGDLSLWISFLAVALPAWGASIHAIASLLEHARIAERSKRMAEVLERIAERARRTTTIETLAKEICIAEELMAAENHEWVVSLKFRELVLPA